MPPVIAEVGLGHDGSLGLAHAYIDVIARCGADAVKFQTHIAAEESSVHETFRVEFSRQDRTRWDYWQRTAFTPEQWAGLKGHADDAGLLFLSSPFSVAAVDLLERLEIPAWKVASGEVNSLSMIERMAKTGRPLFVSTGMSDYEEIGRMVDLLRSLAPDRFLLMQCTTAYPSPPDAIGLNVIDELRRRFCCPVGLSDHSGTIYPALIAAARGAAVVEVHVTLSRDMFGPDVKASLTPDDLARLVEGLRWLRAMDKAPVDKDVAAAAMAPLRNLFGKGAMAIRDLEVGEVLSLADIHFRKPKFGLDERQVRALAGRRFRCAVAKGTFIKADDLA
ncbi:MAG: N-acetylneuraminate synthase family protein [Magnetospirillum sp.]|nr:N-acetylneuraminate synthase family protein [Magnetospirillum sp.]